MKIFRACKKLQCPIYVLKRFKDYRHCRLLLIFMVIMVVVLLASLPLNKPLFYSKYIAINRWRNVSKYIYRYPGTTRNLKSTYKILLWTPYFGSKNWDFKDLSIAFDDCPVFNCVLTSDKLDVNSSDVLIFHVRDFYYPQTFMKYTFYTTYHSLPKHRSHNQIWILMNQESPVNDNMNYGKFNGVFNWTETYRQASEVHTLMARVEKRSKTDVLRDVVVDVNRAGVAWIASNCFDHARRYLLVHELKKYIHVDEYGRCGKKKITPHTYENILRKYKFYLAFENSACEEYITEKFFNSLRDGSLPVVFGGGFYKEKAPPHSYIDIRDFNGAKEVAAYLNYLDKNKTAYNKYFEWKKEYKLTFKSQWCSLCEALNVNRIPHQVYTDLEGWFNDGSTCHSLSVLEKWSKIIDGWVAQIGII